MDRIDRIKRLDEILATRRRPVPLQTLCDELDCVDRTVYRIIDDLRDRFGMPVEHKPGQGYYLDRSQPDAPHRLPDLWFTAEELEALLILGQHLENLEPGLLADRLKPARNRIENLLIDRRPGLEGLTERVRFIAIGQRKSVPRHFAVLAEAMIQRRAVQITYHARTDNRESERIIDPQRIVHYRDNWYLDAWCRDSEAFRTFSIDRIRKLQETGESARDFPTAELDRHFASSYGIFAGEPQHVATIRFTARGARWAADVEWHPEQHSEWRDDGSFELQIPYNQPEELLRDVLAYGPDAEIVAPDELREAITSRIENMMEQYHVT